MILNKFNLKNNNVMKKRIFVLPLLIVGLMFAVACQDNPLVETPRDFLTPDNAYNSIEGIEQGITGIYVSMRLNWYRNGGAQSYGLFGLGTDINYDGENPGGQRFMTNYETTVTPQFNVIESWWRFLYGHIQQSNLLIRSIENFDEWSNEEQQRRYLAEARFFRAWSHRMAVTLWGDVPLVTEVVDYAKVDFVRTPKEQVYDQIVEDLLYAADNLPVPGSESAPGRITQGVALHLLTEVYLAMGEDQLAVNASSRVIQDYGYALMTERFGAQTDVFGSGDVYYDLFRYDNQNPPGNTEAIWVIQFEPNVEGGSNNYWAGIFGPRYFSWGNTPDGFSAFHNTFSDTLGRPVSRNRGTDLVHYHVWESDWDNDIRNAPHNIKRDFYFENPASEFHAQRISTDLYDYSTGQRSMSRDTINYIYPYFMKTFEPVVEVRDKGADPSTGAVHTGFYAMRLAETYLLRAEAYVNLGNNALAADDINVVRNRANATPVSPGDVDIDYILDERIRELYAEEMRLITLMRMDKLIDRTRRYHDNPFQPGANIQEHNRLFPIPQSQIDLNRDADFPQNPGY
jgi:starch-binding outer membrane protein, SusD/RagB family